ncbi:LuxR C-terminal-related transcriptional regulator [Pendulispora albinea]|uniref:LuxR C-terminal-related transcriptional regulator n=1 Tax=Pendulispora albinea TaxID=2741071 RepID=A0ABZ2LT70_9BACT
MRSLVPASGAFICFGDDRTVSYAHSWRMVEDTVKPVRRRDGINLAQAFGLESRDVVRTARRAYRTVELYTDDIRKNLPYFRDNSAADAFVRALLVPLHASGSLFGICGLERRQEEPDFTRVDLQRAEQVAPFVLAATQAHMKSNELQKEATALHSLASCGGTLLAVDRGKRCVTWVASSEEGVDWPAQVNPLVDEVFALAISQDDARGQGDRIAPTSRLCERTVLGISNIEDDSLFGSGACVILHLGALDGESGPEDKLSTREQEVARLLVAGYSRINIAALMGLSENTVRTYMRRLYTKLGISNRVDLVRELIGPTRKWSPHARSNRSHSYTSG